MGLSCISPQSRPAVIVVPLGHNFFEGMAAHHCHATLLHPAFNRVREISCAARQSPDGWSLVAYRAPLDTVLFHG